MREYVADSNIGKKLYMEKRKFYKRYKIGMMIMVVPLFIMVIINLYLVMQAENTRQAAENVFIGFGIDIVFIIGAFLARAFAISGGSEVLRSRVAERCILNDNFLILEYVPHLHETFFYKCIQYQILYEDIEEIVEEKALGRIALRGTYQVLKYRVPYIYDGMESYTVSDGLMYIYAYYKEFDDLESEIKRKMYY